MSMLFERKTELRLYTTTQMHALPGDAATGYKMSFDIFATSKSEPNTAVIEVWGLSEDQRSLFGPDLLYVEFWAGFSDPTSFGMIFRGSWDSSNSVIEHSREGTDWHTRIETGDGLKELHASFINKSYPAGTPLLSILSETALSFGLPLISEFTRVENLLHGATFTGRASRILDDLAWSYKFDWSIQHGSVLITERDEPSRALGVTHVLNNSTGLVGRPTVTAEGIEVKTMMLSTIKPKSLIQLLDETIPNRIGQLADRAKQKVANNLRSQVSQSGIYVVDEIQYYGDNRAGDFNCTVKALFE